MSVKIAQIGVGGWGKNHARVLSEMGVLGAICDGNAERCKEFSSKYSVPAYETVDELLKSEDFDAAFVHWHCLFSTNLYLMCNKIQRYYRIRANSLKFSYTEKGVNQLDEITATLSLENPSIMDAKSSYLWRMLPALA